MNDDSVSKLQIRQLSHILDVSSWSLRSKSSSKTLSSFLEVSVDEYKTVWMMLDISESWVVTGLCSSYVWMWGKSKNSFEEKGSHVCERCFYLVLKVHKWHPWA